MRAAFSAGVRDFGENKIQEAEGKIAELGELRLGGLVWHMVGHLQSNKARRAAVLFDVVHSLDDPALGPRLEKAAAQQRKVLKALVQVDLAGEETKFGLEASRLFSALDPGISGIDERIIKHGGYSDEVYNTLIERCVKIVEKGKLWHEFMPGYTIDIVIALVKKFYMKHKIGLVVFDYIKEPNASGSASQRKEYQLLGDVTTKLKDIAGELQIPVLAAVQINRDGEIADSDRIARYADVISFWSAREKKEIDEFPAGGSYKLWIKDSRRGGSTPKEGLGYHFFRSKLSIKEVDISNQMLKDSLMKGVLNAYTSDEIQ